MVLAQLRLDRDVARVARGLVLRTQRGRLSSVSLQPAGDGPTLLSLTDVAWLRSRDAARAQAYASERRSHVVENMPCEIKRYLQWLYHEFTHDGERILDWHKSVRQIKFVPLFGFPTLVLDRAVPVKWVDTDPNWTWDAVVRRWRAASRSRASIPEVE